VTRPADAIPARDQFNRESRHQRLEHWLGAVEQRDRRARATADRRAAAGIEGRMRLSALLETFEKDALPALALGAADAYRDSLKPIRRYFVDDLGDPVLDAIQAKHIDAYMTWRRAHRIGKRKGAISSRTIAKDRAVLHRLFALADRLAYRAGNPVARTEPPNVDTYNPVILTSDQYDALVAACADRPMLALYVLVLGETGVRCNSETLWLRWEDVDLEHNFLGSRAGGRAPDEERRGALDSDDVPPRDGHAGPPRRVPVGDVRGPALAVAVPP
jgi:hypothetical protein